MEIDSGELDTTTEHVLVGLTTMRPLRKALPKSSGVEPRRPRSSGERVNEGVAKGTISHPD